ncbi:MAG: metallophosphoesterase family protein [Myxococcales bacterium]|nr:metallophosphoesterase family protein [Myxococcales bacterium]
MNRQFKLLAASLILVVVLAPVAFAAPRWVRVSVPASDPDTSETIAWNTDATPDNNTVEFGTAQGALTGSAAGKSFTAKGKLGIGHEVIVNGLKADTQYFYRVGGGSDWSSVHSFRTAPKAGCGSFKFIASGDHRSDDTVGPNPKWASILAEMAANGATFILETGDLVKDGDDINQWHNHMEMAAAKSGEIALMPSFGNHDSDSVKGAAAMYNQIWALPTNPASNTEDFYCFPYGNAVFCALSTATFDDAAGLAMQAKWLDTELSKHADKPWKFVYFHHPCYTSFIDLKLIELNHPPDEKKQNSHFIPVFDKHHVDIVFAGHNHFYERFAPMKGGAIVGSPKDGTLYITTGGAGAFTYDEIDILGFKIEPMKVICAEGFLGFSGKAKGSQFCSGKHHFIEVEIKGGDLTAVVKSTAAQNFGTNISNIAVMETIKISKTAPIGQNCSTAGQTDSGGTADSGAADSSTADAGSATDSGGVADTGPTADAGSSDLVVAADTVAPADSAIAKDTAAIADAAGAVDLAPSVDTPPPVDTLNYPDEPPLQDGDTGADADADAKSSAGTQPELAGGSGSLGPLDAASGTATATAKPAASSSGCQSQGRPHNGAALIAVVFSVVALIGRRRFPAAS